jgi:succinate dehydrogenase hydrophobic anchor subunit
MRIFQMQRIGAIALVIFMTIHMVVVHYPPFHIDFNQIIDRMAQPLWKGIDIAFLFFVLLHALTGAYAVLMDLESVNKFKRILVSIVFVIGIVAFIYGAVTIFAFQPTTKLTAVAP